MLELETNHSATSRNTGSSGSDTSEDDISKTTIADLFDNFKAAFKRRVCRREIHLAVFSGNSHVDYRRQWLQKLTVQIYTQRVHACLPFLSASYGDSVVGLRGLALFHGWAKIVLLDSCFFFSPLLSVDIVSLVGLEER
jgi:hypothetical protein